MEIEIVSKPDPQSKPRDKRQTQTIPHQQIHRIEIERAPKQQQEPLFSDKEIKRLLENLRKEMHPFNHRLQFRVNKEINRIVVKVIDKKTDKVIKEIPPAEIQHMIASIRRTLGLLIDEAV